MTSDERAMPENEKFQCYNARLAKIYESEQSISGMPIKMDRLNLFSVDRPSSTPLNLAYKAAQLAESEKADQFLYQLRYATIVEQRETNRDSEIFSVVKAVGMNIDRFMQHYTDGSAQRALDEDWQWRADLGLRELPAYLFEYQGKQTLIAGVLNFEHLAEIIQRLTQGKIQPKHPEYSSAILQNFVKKHPLVSLIELKYAFGFADDTSVLAALTAAEINFQRVGNGYFVQICI